MAKQRVTVSIPPVPKGPPGGKATNPAPRAKLGPEPVTATVTRNRHGAGAAASQHGGKG
jgi:hypothetical protein